ncbi:MAG TPA: FAD-binding oxidoreductase, partial [Candidatus Limnocylindrales bacterium]|nr:FAD-binding oxidoreductase [Candidatus Limnocylindrales bacterium]
MALTAIRGRLNWQLADVTGLVDETPRIRTIELEAPDWSGHLPGQHVDVRLTAEDGYRAQRSYSIATPADGSRLAITVERIEDGEVSPYLAGELRAGDKLELRGPIGGYFVWEPSRGGPLLLVGGGSGIVPLMAMIRERVAMRSWVSVRLLASSRSWDDVVYRSELDAISRNEMGM